jgi:hypothetical protein
VERDLGVVEPITDQVPPNLVIYQLQCAEWIPRHQRLAASHPCLSHDVQQFDAAYAATAAQAEEEYVKEEEEVEKDAR